MNKELILKYKEEFDHWVIGGRVYAKSISDGAKWTIINDDALWNASPSHFVGIVIDDVYKEFRKALAEGKTIEYNRKNEHKPQYDDWVTYESENFYSSVSIENLRIKPDEPKIKVGDWVIHPVDGAMFKVDQSHIDVPMPWTGFKLWQPQHGEWCWFWDNKGEAPYFSKFNRIYANSHFIDCENEYYNYCEPFIGELPSNLKD